MSTLEAANPVTLNALYELEDLMADVNKSFTDSDVPALEDAGIDVKGAMELFINDDEASGSNAFVSSLREKVQNGEDLSLRQTRAILNIFREKALGLPHSWGTDTTLDPSFDGSYKCNTCKEGFDNFAVLVKHKIDEHDFEPSFGSAAMAVSSPVPVLASAPETGLDISEIPDGYYFAPLPNSYGRSPVTFLQIKRLRKNRSLRNRRYRYGKVITGAEFVPAGTIEVRELSSDSKRLAGEQRGLVRDGENYNGEFEMHLRIIGMNPKSAAKQFAENIGRCGRCGKLLTDDISRSDGFGPECIHHVDNHFATDKADKAEAWGTKYKEDATKTCPSVGCKLTDGQLVEGEDELYECSAGHLWVVRKSATSV